ncbi:MAG: repressor LexA [Armatimonadetes bacterium CG_4_10_14_3_um_filter_66_18]|nr:transcriptional repressor LexA [Armatimonadota bacterium]OIO94729.1 MAG: repressor LexA [Armatimonadetes bacterium CG2_30_66_41]PIU90556.1 MAG: repressor LexA [Armatimonadetes bacterium CG06_land_8_20_14_3_00_66_21]PIW20235.1 MAG: repressor LexA [Armatimonadetes bacterium CG17_big_fil_post_rev_8_21_14_2_50_66_6]PIX38854.1 MAG: repressor LexA [Armatimonadetes bacterium CG_4_8_14_3_um_filter_66_20]PIY43709.1 MAG: repressor LexA [Armatimonadetes bacterium CG_4_10_14_3_um_filter_66_18]PIZ35892
MADLTDVQRRILTAISELNDRHKFPPSIRELCAHVGLKSPCSVYRHLNTLEQKGYISRRKSANRGLTVLRGVDHRTRPQRTTTIPLVGTIAAGMPLLAEQNIEDAYAVSTELVPNEDSFMLRIKGDSMIGAGIFDGDLVVVRRQDSADDGDIVAALLDDEATVKRFYRENGHIRLQPENPAMEPLLVEEVRILGKVTLAIRRL